ncbi:hypothetical protein E2C01_025508 [Portunus trituberculatus]|uniref:Uncharacterized protein n=1 Tax=Portunus trituberculatus TaxID=210409 RepID=A0A5B7EDJ6_PORTR|nr:hypothetical protein [Portunus trituberculatus]
MYFHIKPQNGQPMPELLPGRHLKFSESPPEGTNSWASPLPSQPLPSPPPPPAAASTLLLS